LSGKWRKKSYLLEGTFYHLFGKKKLGKTVAQTQSWERLEP